ncbi:PIR Superfamily Protein [Plasmodium ovale wallikeri]|uniref:PIR Superfamily Protein n=1 Tax=Plasmodium ovale wallikeri TaxID=864142 RepID=A0A1A9AHB1_PLAOA|nr:PIR Superfamily Protein [Plasmodium ovale wallikeri]SBT55539.1 PIR Superfamily Protein [Plasmodium ovale wallikeri]
MKEIDVSELPSVKFVEELKSKIDYNTVNSFVKNITTNDEINAWITKFESNTEEYFNKLPEETLRSRDKYCRDFYYLTFDILKKIESLSENPLSTHNLRERVKDIRNKYYSSKPGFFCKNKYTYLKNEEKQLYYFCEDIDFIKKKATNIKTSDQCQSIIDNMSTRKDNLIGIRNLFERGGKVTQITDTCNNYILGEVFPFFSCTPRDKQAVQHSASFGSDHHADSQQLGKDLGAQSFSPYGESAIAGQAFLTNPEKSEANNNSTINEIISVSVPILVFTPFGPKLQTFLKRKSDIRVNQGDNPISPLLADTSNYEDIYSDNMQYNISYHNV